MTNNDINNNNGNLTLNADEEEAVLEYDSRLFGFIKIDSNENMPKKLLLIKAIQVYEKRSSTVTDPIVQAKCYTMLGHWHLLLNDYNKSLSFYQKFYEYDLEEKRDSTFLYGLGLVYFYFSAFRFAIKAFLCALYKDPGFLRSNEIHFRLGLIYKELNEFEFSLKYLNLAYSDSSTGSVSKQEIKFCIAHLFEINNKNTIACEKYEELLKYDDLSDQLRAKVLRQLGWLYFYSCDHEQVKHVSSANYEKAIELLIKSTEYDSTQCLTWYYLGRVHAFKGNVTNAFNAYRNIANSSESNADTWCSIGILYQQQNQAMDALQAYICAVQLDNKHYAAWLNLGVLYETLGQYNDALNCYMKAINNDINEDFEEQNPKQQQQNIDQIDCNRLLEERISILKAYLQRISHDTIKNKLPTLQEAFSSPIAAELTSRQNSSTTHGNGPSATVDHKSNYPGPMSSSHKPTSNHHHHHHQQQHQQQSNQNQITGPDNFAIANGLNGSSSTSVIAHGIQANVPPAKRAKTSKKLHLMHQLESNRNLNPDQVQMLNYLKSQFSLMQQQQQKPGMINPAIIQQQHVHPQTNAYLAGQYHRNHPQQANQQRTMQLMNMLDAGHNGMGPLGAMDCLPHDLENVNPIMNPSSIQDLNFLLSRHDIAEDLRNTDGLDHILAYNASNGSIQPTSMSTKQNLKQHIANRTGNVDGSQQKKYPIEMLKLEASLGISVNTKPSEPHVHIDMTAHQIIKSCKSHGLNGIQTTSILSPKCQTPIRTRPYAQLTKDQLSPITPSVIIESKRDAVSSQLQQYCLSNPICVIRNLAGVLKLDLSLFSTKSLVETDAEHIVEVRTQRQQASDENWDLNGKKKVWKCDSSRSYMTIAKYAQYQAFTFQDSLKDNHEQHHQPKGHQHSNPNDSVDDNMTAQQHRDESFDKAEPNTRNNNSNNKKFKLIKFCTNVDLSDEKKWTVQLQELAKLPPYMRIVAACNMLSHVGHKILGMNTLQLYMKVPGARTPGHQENNNFCSININIGPGDCEWFGVAECYWPIIDELCDKNSVDYLTGSWWPKLDDLYENNVPVYRFIQKPGDMVWVNTGCVHWVQSIGWCNNIAWNVGPLTYGQFKSAIERYEWNKFKHYQSIVPILHLTWNIARNVKVSDRRLYELIKYVLMQSLKQSQLILNYVESCELEIKAQPRQPIEPAYYCVDCDGEVFNVLFVSEQDKKHVVHCQDCARRRSHILDNFVILNQYTMDELKTIYDQFTLYTPQFNGLA